MFSALYILIMQNIHVCSVSSSSLVISLLNLETNDPPPLNRSYRLHIIVYCNRFEISRSLGHKSLHGDLNAANLAWPVAFWLLFAAAGFVQDAVKILTRHEAPSLQVSHWPLRQAKGPAGTESCRVSACIRAFEHAIAADKSLHCSLSDFGRILPAEALSSTDDCL